MPEVSSVDAARIIRVSEVTIRRHVYGERLPARREGLLKRIFIEVDDLRALAEKYHYRFDETLAAELAK